MEIPFNASSVCFLIEEETNGRRRFVPVFDAKIAEELGGDAVVASFGEVPPAHEVSTAEMDAHMHV